MRNVDEVVQEVLSGFESTGYAEVPGYARFGFHKRTDSRVFVLRRNGNTAAIPNRTLAKAIEAVRKDQSVYRGGPSRLREFGITHIASPTWAILHVVPLSRLIN